MLILIVQEDEDTRQMYQDSLESHGYEVVTASHGAEGVALARRLSPDLILMDIRLPIMDGQQAMRYLKSDSATWKIPIFGISPFGNGDQGVRLPGKLQFDRLLVKPLEVDLIIAAIQERIGLPRLRHDVSG